MVDLSEVINKRNAANSAVINGLAHYVREEAMSIILSWIPIDQLNEALPTLARHPKIGDGTPDAALAIGEHAFRAGWEARDEHQDGYADPAVNEAWLQRSWSDYEPSEDIKALS